MTKKLVLLGFPLSHSVSPAMHTAALADAGLDGWSYEALPVPADQLGAAVARLRSDEYAGANVTVPHKEAILPLLDGVTPLAGTIGAVNTVVKVDGKLIGHNTDAAGLLADLQAHGVHLARRAVLVLGAGGAARAAVAGCAGMGARVRVVARRAQQAASLRAIDPGLKIFEWSPVGFLQACDDCALILNTTPLGMAPRSDDSPWLEGTPFPPQAFVYDLVYNPSETRFVRQARADGLRAATGLGMLVEQGALAFELWTRKTAPRLAMRRAAEAQLDPVSGPSAFGGPLAQEPPANRPRHN